MSFTYSQETLVGRESHAADFLQRFLLFDEFHAVALLVFDVSDANVLA